MINKRIWLFGCLLGSILLMASSASMVAAMPSQIIPGLDTPSANTTRADLEQFVRIALSRQLIYTQGMAYYNQLTREQRHVVGDIVQQRIDSIGVSRHVQQAPPGTVTPQDIYGDCIEQGDTQCWKEPVEYNDVSPGNSVTFWYTDQYSCDNDQDYDYIFYIPLDLHSDPDGARWFTDDFALWLATGSGGSLNGQGYSYSEMRLCIGDNTLIAAGFSGSNAGGEAAVHIFGRYR